MLKIFKSLLIKLSRIVFWLTPSELIDKTRRVSLTNKIHQNLVEETFKNFKENFKKSILFTGQSKNDDAWKLREHAIKTALSNDKDENLFYLELGVWKGDSANFFSSYIEKLYAFDSFEGLPEDWVGTSFVKNTFDNNKQIPKLNSNVEPIVGLVEDTLDDFIKKHEKLKINFIHFDFDIYSPTKFALEKLKPFIVKGAIIVFDQLYNYTGWEHGEYKALNEVFKENEFEYKAFVLGGCQVAIQIK